LLKQEVPSKAVDLAKSMKKPRVTFGKT